MLPTLADIRDFIHFLSETYGALSSILILALIYMVWQLRNEQKENRELRIQMAEAFENNVAIQLKTAAVLNDIRGAINVIRYKINALSERKGSANAKSR
jgi:formiminotetrahydrofolate cyclodeaminase